MSVHQGRNWPYDPDVKFVPGTGIPPALHLRRCQGILRDKSQCPFWAAKHHYIDDGSGTGYCKSHGANQPRTHLRRSKMGLYSKRASSQLKDLLKDAGKDEKARLNLAEEVDMARILCERAVRLFDGACIGESAKEVSTSLKQASVKLVQESLKSVADMVNSYAKLMLLQDSVFNGVQVDYLTKMLGDILTRHLQEDHAEVLQAVLKEIETTLRAPDKAQSGRPVNITIS